jgi:hypothetical protein
MEGKMTRQHASATALAFLAACGASCSHNAITAPPPTGIVYFQIDGATCKGTHSTYFEIDASEFGPEILAPRQTSSGYSVTEGIHAIKARVVDYVGGSADLWTLNNHIMVPGNGTAMAVIVC